VVDAFSEAKKLGDYYLPETVSQLSPLVDTVASSLKSNVEKLPSEVTEGLYSQVVDKVVDVTGRVDTMACHGLDKLTQQLPVLKEPTAKVLETTKTTSSSWVNEQVENVQKYVKTDFETPVFPGLQSLVFQLNAIKEMVLQRFTSESKLHQTENLDIMRSVVDITSQFYSMLATRVTQILPINMALFKMENAKDKKDDADELTDIKTGNNTHSEDKNGEPLATDEKSSKANIITKEEFGRMGERKASISE